MSEVEQDFELVRDLFNRYTPGSDGRTQQDRTEFFAALTRIQKQRGVLFDALDEVELSAVDWDQGIDENFERLCDIAVRGKQRARDLFRKEANQD